MVRTLERLALGFALLLGAFGLLRSSPEADRSPDPSVLRRMERGLKRQADRIDALQTRIQQLELRPAPQPAPRPVQPPAPAPTVAQAAPRPAPAPVDEAVLRAQELEEHARAVAELDARLADEVRDPDWAERTERNIQAVVGDLQVGLVPGLKLLHQDCKRSVCFLELELGDEQARSLGLRLLAVPGLEQGRLELVEGPDGTPDRALAWLSRAE